MRRWRFIRIRMWIFRDGRAAARLLLRIVAGEVRPVTAKVTVPALVRGDELITETGSIRHAVNAAKAIEASAGGLSAAMMWGIRSPTCRRWPRTVSW